MCPFFLVSASEARATMTLPSASRPLLMWVASLSSLPADCDRVRTPRRQTLQSFEPFMPCMQSAADQNEETDRNDSTRHPRPRPTPLATTTRSCTHHLPRSPPPPPHYSLCHLLVPHTAQHPHRQACTNTHNPPSMPLPLPASHACCHAPVTPERFTRSEPARSTK